MENSWTNSAFKRHLQFCCSCSLADLLIQQRTSNSSQQMNTHKTIVTKVLRDCNISQKDSVISSPIHLHDVPGFRRVNEDKCMEVFGEMPLAFHPCDPRFIATWQLSFLERLQKKQLDHVWGSDQAWQTHTTSKIGVSGKNDRTSNSSKFAADSLQNQFFIFPCFTFAGCPVVGEVKKVGIFNQKVGGRRGQKNRNF